MTFMNLKKVKKVIKLAKKELKIDRFLAVLVMLIVAVEWSHPQLSYAQVSMENRSNVFRFENEAILTTIINSQIQTNTEKAKIAQIQGIPPVKVKRTVFIMVTAYSSTPDQTDDTPFITASGSYVRDGIIATNFLRFGTKVRFPDKFGDKIFVVEDRMHPRFYHRADIWMSERQLAKEFGVKTLKMEILEN